MKHAKHVKRTIPARNSLDYIIKGAPFGFIIVRET